MGVYEDLLAWSKSRPLWQRDALRRLVEKGSIQSADVTELGEIALAEARGTQPKALPVQASHFPHDPDNRPRIVLGAIVDVENVNALADGSRLPFSPGGITAIFGDNGSGKSGYVRILRKVCRARAVGGPVHPNVYRASAGLPAATIEYADADTPRSVRWRSGTPSDSALAAISVFDRDCASVYVVGENEVAYRPLGLDLLDQLAVAANNVRADLEQTKTTLRRALADPPTAAVEHLRALKLWPLTATTKPDRLAPLAKWTSEDAAELASIDAALGEQNPADRIAALGVVVRSRERLLERLTAVAQLVSDNAVQAVAGALEEAARLSAARDELAHAAFEDSPLPHTEGAKWRQLWDAAREYSTKVAYADHPFPHVGAGALCVFCGQPLEDDAARRLSGYAQFVEAAVASDLAEHEERLGKVRSQLTLVVDSQLADEDLVANAALAEESTAVVAAFRVSARDRAANLVAAIDARSLSADATLALSPIATVKAQAQRAREELNLLTLAGQPDAAATLTQRRDVLLARQWLHSSQDDIRAELDRLRRIAQLESAIAACNTYSITTQSSELTERYVSRRLSRTFGDLLNSLSAGQLKVRVAKRGQRGATYHRLELADSKRTGVRIDEVISEGEYGAVAIASFLAELDEAAGAAAIVLDDPVSSLDHNYRRRVAWLLAAQAIKRQVIVFTHDLVFLHDLEKAAKTAGAVFSVSSLRQRAGIAGINSDGPPWIAMKVNDRLAHLRRQLENLRKSATEDEDLYELQARDWYGLLRETWERAMEEVLFGGVVLRYRHSIETNRATSEKIWLIEREDITALEGAISKCSSFIRGHDQPEAVNQPVPAPDELEADVGELAAWRTRIIQRRK